MQEIHLRIKDYLDLWSNGALYEKYLQYRLYNAILLPNNIYPLLFRMSGHIDTGTKAQFDKNY